MPPDDLVPSVEAAEILQVDRSTLSRLVAFGVLAPAMKLPGKTGAMLFRRSVVEAVAAKRDALRQGADGAAEAAS